LYASEIAVKVADDCVQIHGGYGFVKDYPAEKYFRDVKLTTIGEGTSEIERLVIARQLLTRWACPRHSTQRPQSTQANPFLRAPATARCHCSRASARLAEAPSVRRRPRCTSFCDCLS